MSRNVRWSMIGLAVLFGATLLTTSGCKKKPSCELLYKRLDKCDDDFALKKDKFLKLCNKKKDKPIVKVQIQCSKYADCDKFKKCIKESEKKVAAERLKERIEKAIASGKLKDALSTCKYSKKRLTDDLKKKCADLQVKQYKTLKDKAVKIRDKGDKNDWGLCSDLKELAKELGGGDKTKEAEALCAEMTYAQNLAKAIKKATEGMSKPKPSIPFNCGYMMLRLSKAKVMTPWLTKRKKDLVNQCYVKLGKTVMEKWLAGKPRYCFQLRSIYKAVKQYGIADPTLKGLIDKAKPICKKEFEKYDAELAKEKAAARK